MTISGGMNYMRCKKHKLFNINHIMILAIFIIFIFCEFEINTVNAVENKITKNTAVKSTKNSKQKKNNEDTKDTKDTSSDTDKKISDEQNGAGFQTKANYAILIDYASGNVLYEKNADVRMVPSSMTKIMTTYVVFDALNKNLITLNDKFRVSKNAWSMGGSRMFLQCDDDVSVDDLLRGVVVQSGNDACVVLAEGMFGSESVFVDHMNQTAERFGLTNTHFKNTNGLPDEGHFSSARDLAIISQYLIRDFPQYYSYHQEKEFTHNGIKQYNRNTLIGINGIDGIKTGHTDDGGYGIVVSAKHKTDNDIRLIAVLNGMKSEKERAEEANKIITWGMNNFVYKTLYNSGDKIIDIEVLYGDKVSVPGVVHESVKVIIPKTDILAKNKSSNGVQVKVKYYEKIKAPIIEGQKVGEIEILNRDGHIMKKLDIFAKENVEKANFIQRIIQNIELLILKHVKS